MFTHLTQQALIYEGLYHAMYNPDKTNNFVHRIYSFGYSVCFEWDRLSLEDAICSLGTDLDVTQSSFLLSPGCPPTVLFPWLEGSGYSYASHVDFQIGLLRYAAFEKCPGTTAGPKCGCQYNLLDHLNVLLQQLQWVPASNILGLTSKAWEAWARDIGPYDPTPSICFR